MARGRLSSLLAHLSTFLLPWLLGSGLAYLFWSPLFEGAGITGGDTYAYFFPLKQLYAEGLKANTIWFWNPRIGQGIPVLGESQTGVFYPPYLLAYRFLDLDRAYTTVFLVHYVLAFVFTTWLARAAGVSQGGALLVATVFVYGWFPPRSCFEWAIVTGAWMPLILCMGLRFLQSGRYRWGWGMALALLLQLLAGHFQIAFMTLLAVGWVGVSYRLPLGAPAIPASRRAQLLVFLLFGFLLAAPQLLPVWELKLRSQRSTADVALLTYGVIPLKYFLQLIAPFVFYVRGEGGLIEIHGVSNNIETHLYVGLIPIGLALILIVRRWEWRQWWLWLALAAAGAILASGILHHWLHFVPGFSYFHAPGRYGLLIQLGLAMLAGYAVDQFSPQPYFRRVIFVVAILVVTTSDLLWVSGEVSFTTLDRPPLIERTSQSAANQVLKQMDRVLAPVPNVLSLTGASSVPPYLGLAPQEYQTVWDVKVVDKILYGERKGDKATLDHLRDAGVTHFLTRYPLPADWPVITLWSGIDPFLHPLFIIRDPLYLYRFEPSLGRVYLRERGKPAADTATGSASIRNYQPQKVTFECEVRRPMQVVLSDLNYPGWTATVDGKPTEPAPDPIYRVVELAAGKHTVVWSFYPRLLWPGIWISITSLLGMILMTGVVSRRRRNWARRL